MPDNPTQGMRTSRSAEYQRHIPDLCAHWKFDEYSGLVLRDRSGNGRDGTLNGPVWANASTPGLLFDGVNDSVLFAAPGIPEVSDVDGVTFMGWFRDSDRTGVRRHFSTLVDGNNDISAAIVGGALYFEVGNGQNTYGLWPQFGATIGATARYHAAFVFDGTQDTFDGKIRIIVNGVQRTLTSSGGVYPARTAKLTAQPFRLGSDGGGAADFYAGVMDSFRVFRRPLKTEEVLYYFNTGS